MPYIIIRGNLASYSNRNPWRVLVSGLKADDIVQLNRFPSGGYCDDSTIVYMQHPCVILTALEVIGYRVVASSSTSVKQDYNEYMWTMRKEFNEPEPSVSSLDRAIAMNLMRQKPPTYIAVKGSLHSGDCSIFGLHNPDLTTIKKIFTEEACGEVLNGVSIRHPPMLVINRLSELGYRINSCTGDAEIVWMLGKD